MERSHPYQRDLKTSLIYPPFCETMAYSHNMFGLHYGVWVIDWLSPQAYNVSVMAPFER